MDQRDLIVVEQHIELASKSAEVLGLDLDQLVASNDVHDESRDRHLESVSRMGDVRLQRRMQRALVERSYPGHPHTVDAQTARSARRALIGYCAAVLRTEARSPSGTGGAMRALTVDMSAWDSAWT